MSRPVMNDRQRAFFDLLGREPELIFACGPKGVSVNLVGAFSIGTERGDDVIHVGDGTDHVHVDWERVRRVEHGSAHGEGLLEFFDGEERLFRFYRPAGPFPEDVRAACGDLSTA